MEDDFIPTEEEFAKRIESEARAGGPILCRDLVCRDCAYRYDDTDNTKNGKSLFNEEGRLYAATGFCEVYEDFKPNSVLKGEGCEFYKPE